MDGGEYHFQREHKYYETVFELSSKCAIQPAFR